MPQYLIAIQHPEDYDPSLEDEAMIREIAALNEEMDAAGARFFAGGLESARHARSLRKRPGGGVSITDGPYLEAKRLLDPRLRRPGRGPGLGSQGRRRLPCSRRGAGLPEDPAEAGVARPRRLGVTEPTR